MKLPKSWNKISLNTFSKLSNIKDTDNDITNLINRLVVLTGEPIGKVEQLKYGQVMKLTKKLSYLNELPTAKKNTWFIYKGDVFKLIDIDNISNQDFIELNDIIESNINEGDKLAKCIHKLYKSVRKKEYDYNHFLELSIGKSYSTILFFWSFVKDYYSKYLKHCLIQMEKMTMNQIKEMKEQGIDIQLNKRKMKRLIGILKNGNGIVS